ncbi:unnamed protein product, partial [Ixodes persulcatus]
VQVRTYIVLALVGGAFADYLSDVGIETGNGISALSTDEISDLPVYRDDPPLVKTYKSDDVIGAARRASTENEFATENENQGVTYYSSDATPEPAANLEPSSDARFYQRDAAVTPAPAAPRGPTYSTFTPGRTNVAAPGAVTSYQTASDRKRDYQPSPVNNRFRQPSDSGAVYPYYTRQYSQPAVSTFKKQSTFSAGRRSGAAPSSFSSFQSGSGYSRRYQLPAFTYTASGVSRLPKYGAYNSDRRPSNTYQRANAVRRPQAVSRVTKMDPFHSSQHTTVHYAPSSGARSSSVPTSMRAPSYGSGIYRSQYEQGSATYGHNYARTRDVRTYRNYLRKKCKYLM